MSPYSKNTNPKRLPGQQANITLLQQNPNAVGNDSNYATADERGNVLQNSSGFNNGHNAASVSNRNNNNGAGMPEQEYGAGSAVGSGSQTGLSQNPGLGNPPHPNTN